jgi:hypothetical protein
MIAAVLVSLLATGAAAAPGATPVHPSTPATIPNAQIPFGGDVSHAGRDILLRLDYTGGYGTHDPSFFTVTILGDRSVTFVGFDPRLGRFNCCGIVRKSVIPPGAFRRLVEQVDRLRFWKLKLFYNQPTDVPAQSIVLVDGPYVFSTRFSTMACNGSRAFRDDFAPQALCELEASIEKTTGADRWGLQTSIERMKGSRHK